MGDLPPLVHPCTPPLAPPSSLAPIKDEAKDSSRRQPRSIIPSEVDILAEEEHEVVTRRKRVVDSASKRRHSLCLTAKEAPFYESATSKASRVQAAKLDLSEASTRMKAALDTAGVLERPPPSASHRASCTSSPTCVAFHALPTAAKRCSPLCDVYYNACFLWRLAARRGSPSTEEGPVSV